ncbi:hypothetical protein Ahy_B09g094518 isoform A [Arachis hypogaea]|uniref:Uncharacterized protein n=1 Tax=Arachis hypogaea TaxID=3818 RepID=A0A444XBJ4_ARAHY|nr:hypothetical protein Ahy_B09g094518 isoform A [Arachis hypogaea]
MKIRLCLEKDLKIGDRREQLIDDNNNINNNCVVRTQHKTTLLLLLLSCNIARSILLLLTHRTQTPSGSGSGLSDPILCFNRCCSGAAGCFSFSFSFYDSVLLFALNKSSLFRCSKREV